MEVYVVEYRDPQSRQPAFWELSAAVPRDDAGEPVKSGRVGMDDGLEKVVLDSVKIREAAVRLLRERNGGDISVGAVEQAWEAAENRGPTRERRVKASTTAAAAPVSPAEGGPRPAHEPVKTPGPPGRRVSRSFPLGKILLVIVMIAVLIYLWREGVLGI